MERVSGRIGTAVERPVDYSREVGEAIGGVRAEVGPALTAEIAPLPAPQSIELIGGGRNLEQLRLAVPEAANPFETSPMGPRHDYIMARSVVARAREPLAKQLINTLQQPPRGVSEQAISHMRASIARENNMIKLLETHLGAMQEIYNRVIGTQEG